MSLFGFSKKKEEKAIHCDCVGNCSTEKRVNTEQEKSCSAPIKVLGSGCAKCNALEAATIEALKELGMNTEIEHVTGFTKIAAYGVMTTPALVIDGKVVSFGKVLKKDEVVKILQKNHG